MLYACTAEEMRSAEERAVAAGLSLGELMERAGRAVAEDAVAGAPVGRIVVVTGKGKNGGDGWVAARELHAKGRDVQVLALADPAQLAGPAAAAAGAAIDAGVPWSLTSSDAEIVTALGQASLVIDAIFGFGFRGTPGEPYARAIDAVNDCDAAVLSVDMPSGVDADTGAVAGIAVRADVTLTFSAPKVGLMLFPGAEYAGEVRVADIGVPREFVDAAGGIELLDDPDFLDIFPFTAPDAHKHSRGHVVVVAGSRGMTGAAALCAEAALRGGAGFVTLMCADSLVETLAVKLTSVVIRPLPESARGVLSADAADEILAEVGRAHALVLGPGLSRADGPVELSRRLVAGCTVPLVVDADALNAHAGAPEPLLARTVPTVITPHPGELARLLAISSAEVQSDRVAHARRLAGDTLACVLKGARTVVAGEGRCSIETGGDPGMATAGSGDVLAGMVGAMLARGLTPYEAGVLGVHLHARAGEIAALGLTSECVIAPDILAAVPDAVGDLLGR